ncbi:MAG TPA: SDR family oxidoreductase [Clostridiaceae bacterium]|nr:SDR family oxidoreductase [Clostridiaceae bacterium]
MMNILDSFSLHGKVAVITGGAGKYGRQLVRALSQAGAKTYVASRNLDNLKKLAAEINENNIDGKCGTVIPAYVDQGDEASILNLRDEILEHEDKVDILVNNAVSRPMKSWNDDVSKFAESMRINATGLFLMTRTFGDIMAEAGKGSIINIGSIQGMIGPDGTLYEGLSFHGFVPDYFFHKGGMINFTRFVASYYGPRNVRCNCVSPGGFLSGQPEEFIERYSRRTFLGRMANDTDLMGVVVFLASDASLYITGANIPVDGGYTAK